MVMDKDKKKNIKENKEGKRMWLETSHACPGCPWEGRLARYNSLAPLHFCHLSPYRSFWLVDGPAPRQAGPVPQQLRDQDLSCTETGARAKELQAQTGRGHLGVSF